MKLTDLKPQFLKIIDEKTSSYVDDISIADGITFLCPVCFANNGGSRGTHSINCWQPHVGQEHYPNPGRWNFVGTGYDNLELKNGSSSILLNGGCNAHFFIRNGEVIIA